MSKARQRIFEQDKRTARAREALETGAMRVAETAADRWEVTNGNGSRGPYLVTRQPDWACTCGDFTNRCQRLGLRCKHIEAVRQILSEKSTAHTEAHMENAVDPNTYRSDPVLDQIIAALSEPFPASEIKWKPQAIRKDKTAALAVAYIDARCVMVRLDTVVGPFNWQVIHEGDPLVTRLGIKHPLNGEWIWKSDVGFVAGADSSKQDDQVKANKGTPSDGLKRAGVVWGIFRYAYSLPKQWVPWNAEKRMFRQQPTLPPAALPKADRQHNGSRASARVCPEPSQRSGNGHSNGAMTVAEARDVVLHIGDDPKIRGQKLGNLVDGSQQQVITWLATEYNPGDESGVRLKKAATVLHQRTAAPA